MNERIRELAHKAEFINKRHNGDEWRWGYIDYELSAKLEKFAELIVKECIARVEGCAVEFDDNYPNDQFIAGYNKGISKTASQVKQHFGVER